MDADVSTPDGARRVADAVRDAGLGCVGVVASAGGNAPAASDDSLEAIRDHWRAGFDLNVMTAVLLVEALRPALEADGGRVVLLSSVSALRGSRTGSYGASKAALHAWMFDLAAQLGRFGGTANVVAPGFVPGTEFWAGVSDDVVQNRIAQTLVGRVGTAEEGLRDHRLAARSGCRVGDRPDRLCERRHGARTLNAAGHSASADSHRRGISADRGAVAASPRRRDRRARRAGVAARRKGRRDRPLP